DRRLRQAAGDTGVLREPARSTVLRIEASQAAAGKGQPQPAIRRLHESADAGYRSRNRPDALQPIPDQPVKAVVLADPQVSGRVDQQRKDGVDRTEALGCPVTV